MIDASKIAAVAAAPAATAQAKEQLVETPVVKEASYPAKTLVLENGRYHVADHKK